MPASRKIVERARKLRRAMTPPEVRLWQWLRDRPGGFKFRRQHPVGKFVLDFYCPAARLIIEVDGEVHNRGGQPERDEARDAWCAEQGLRVVRVPASLVMQDLDGVSRGIMAICGEQLSEFPLHQPSAGPPPHAAHGEE